MYLLSASENDMIGHTYLTRQDQTHKDTETTTIPCHYQPCLLILQKGQTTLFLSSTCSCLDRETA